MATNERPGTAHWIDHFVVGTNDLKAWLDWSDAALGATVLRLNGLTTRAQKRGQPIALFMDIGDGSCHFGGFLQTEEMPPIEGLDSDEMRYGFFVRRDEIDDHLRRFDASGITHSQPTRTAAEGEAGTAVNFADSDGNQYELWAPDEMPAGAMEVSTHLGVGRISSAVLGSRNLQRTADFMSRFCDLEPLESSEIPEDSLVLPLASGGRLVYRLREGVDERVTGHGPWNAMHVALTVREHGFFPNYRRLWEGVPEETTVKGKSGLTTEELKELPARTGLHGSPVGQMWKKRYERGDEFYDWDGHAFHFMGGLPLAGAGDSLALYRPKDQGEYLRELTEALAVGALPS